MAQPRVPQSRKDACGCEATPCRDSLTEGEAGGRQFAVAHRLQVLRIELATGPAAAGHRPA